MIIEQQVPLSKNTSNFSFDIAFKVIIDTFYDVSRYSSGLYIKRILNFILLRIEAVSIYLVSSSSILLSSKFE